MKKVFNAIMLFALLLTFGGLLVHAESGPAEGEATVVVHFHRWDGDYQDVAAHTWNRNAVEVDVKGTPTRVTNAGVLPTGSDEFGLYFKYFFTPDEDHPGVGFIPVVASSTDPDAGTAVEDWNKKLTGTGGPDVMIDVKDMKAGEVRHVYVFEGTPGLNAQEGEVAYLVADPELVNMLLVYYDPNNAYEENLGIYNWGGWTEAADGSWGTPVQVFSTVGAYGTGAVKAAMLTAAADKASGVGLLIYAGGDDNKRTGDVNFVKGKTYAAGDVEPVFVLNIGAGKTGNENVFIGDTLDNFREEAFSFKFDAGSYAAGTGTFAFTPTVVYTKLSRSIPLGYKTASDDEKAELKETMLGSFTLNEVTVVDGEVTEVGTEIPLEGINFDEYSDETSEFILVIKDENKLDNKKEYQLSFHYQEVSPSNMTLNLTVTLADGVKAPDRMFAVGSMNGWTPGDPTWELLSADEGKTWKLSNTLLAEAEEFEYKYVAGADWNFEELNGSGESIQNRRVGVTEKVVDQADVIAEWKAIQPLAEVKPTEPSVLPTISPYTVVNLTVKMAEGVKAPARMFAVGSMNGWTPGDPTWELFSEDEGVTWKLSNRLFTEAEEFEYKYVAGAGWDFEEFNGSGDGIDNRRLAISSKNIKQNDEIAEWKAIQALADVKPAEASVLPTYEGDVTVILTVTLAEGVKAPDRMFAVGSMNGWTAGDPTWELFSKDGGVTWTVSNVLYAGDLESFEYKYVAGAGWDFEEFNGSGASISNRLMEVNKVIKQNDVIAEWKEIQPLAEVKPTEPTKLPEAPAKDGEVLEATILLELDRKAPVITFISDFDDEEDRVVEIALGIKWNENLFPRYIANDDRDGDITYRVYVPGAAEGNEDRIIDTRTAGDYKIKVKVVDDWGNSTEEVFTFRVMPRK